LPDKNKAGGHHTFGFVLDIFWTAAKSSATAAGIMTSAAS
jgi:hypothetical protein